MWNVVAQSAAVLGAVGGIIIAYFVPDETEWYPKWMLLAACVFVFLAGITVVSPVLAQTSLSLGVLLAGGFIWLLSKKSTIGVSILAGLIGSSTNLFTSQLLLVALLPSASYLFSQGARKELWWFVLTPIIIIASGFLL